MELSSLEAIISAFIVSRDALVEMKRAAGRPQDLIDIQEMLRV